ncbi:MAG: UPF0147 family protein [Candidatus Methanofastidiosia archaeon]
MSEKLISQITEYLDEAVVRDTSVPRNIRRAASDAIKQLKREEFSERVRAYSAIEILDEISNDPNMPMHTRTVIWQILSELERIEG